jgi:hypothetical protein
VDADGYGALIDRDARLSVLCDSTETRALGLFHLVDPSCWLLDAIRLTGNYPRLRRRVCYGVAQSVPCRSRSRGNQMAKAKAAKTAKAKKTAAVKDLSAKNPKSVKGGVLLRKKVFE